MIIIYLRENILSICALLCLLLGLADASQLLGLGMGPISPLATLGGQGFIWLAFFTIARLFAAVGLWINASWGGVLLVSAGLAEFATIMMGLNSASYSFIGLFVRIMLSLTVATVLIYRWWHVIRSVHD